MPSWNLSVVFDAIARQVPDREAVVQGGRRNSWGELATRARCLASFLQAEVGLAEGDKVAIFLSNRAEYLETFYAVRKLRCVALNIPPASSVETIHKIVDTSDAKVVIHAPEADATTHDATRRIQKRWRPVLLATGEAYEHTVAESVPPVDWVLEVPSADDLIFIATRDIGRVGIAPRMLPAAPFAHGNGLATTLGALADGGTVVFADSPRFDADLVWKAVEHERVVTLTIAGDAFAGPLLAAVGGSGEHDLGSLRTIASSGARLSADIARALEAALPDITIVDTYESSGAPASGSPVRGSTAKVHPAEVESRLRKHRSVFDCVVVGVSDPRIGKQVVALIQVTENHYIDEPELAAWCRAHLPSTKTPRRFIFIDKIERSPSGDADYARLHNLAIDRLVDEL